MSTMTAKQRSFILKLAGERVIDTDTRRRLDANLDAFTAKTASDTITWLMAQPRTDNGRSDTPAPEGMHRLNGSIFKVQRAVHGSGNTYAKKLMLDEHTGTWRFDYAPGVVRHLNDDTRLTLEQAKEFGALYGTCCVCGKTLTDENSIAAGIGPVCAGKF